MAPTTNAVTNALDLLDLLGRAASGMRLKDIALQIDLPESTTHRLLASMMSRGYVEQQPDQGLYLLGWKIVLLADSMGRDARLVQMARPWLQRLAREIGHTVNLAVISNGRVMYLDCQTPPDTLGISVPPGWTLPIYATSLGKSILAYTPIEERDPILDGLSFEPLTEHTITSREEFISALEGVRARGYGIDHGEFRLDVCCVAAPLIDRHEQALAAISVTAPTADLPVDWEQTYPAAIHAVAREISETIFGAQRLSSSGVKR